MNPVEVLRFLGGSAPRAALLRHTTRHALEQAVQKKQIERVGWGRYALPGLPPAIKIGAALGGIVSHTTAAAHWMLEGLAEPTTIHLTVPARAHRPPSRSVIFHYTDLDEDAEVTSPIRTVLDCARMLPFREGLAIADSALRRALVTKDELIEASDRLIGQGSRQARRVTRYSSGLAANPFESALRAATIEAGLLGFVPQLEITEDGLTWRVDLADEERRIVAEADSFAFHGTPQALESDCRRYDDLVSRSWLVLRYAWAQVMFDEGWVQRTLLDTYRLRRSRRSGSIRSSTRQRLRRTK